MEKGKYRSIEALPRTHAAYHATDFLDCQKECETNRCLAFETGPKGACTTYTWAAAATKRVPLKATVVPGTKCYVKNAWNAGRRSTGFENMVWKSAETVAFGVKSPWVVAWYCSNTFPTTLKTRNASDRKANVLKTQIVNGYNSAYNWLALRTHNQKRSAH